MSENLMKRRLKMIVDVVFGGKVFPASEATGTTIHRFLYGAAVPRLKTVRQMADAFGLTPEYLLGFSELPEMTDSALSEWLCLIKRYHRHQQQPDRERIAHTDAALLKGLNLLDLPILSSLLATNGREKDQIDAVRKLAEAETALVQLTAAQLKSGKAK